MTFNPIAAPIDHILLANRRSPGVAIVTNANSPRRWDERKGYAQSGARVVFRGIGLARPIVTLRLTEQQHWDDWHAWRELVQRPPIGSRARALDIWHPILEDQDIKAVVVEDVLQPIQVADGEFQIELRFIEFRPPVPRVQTIRGSEATPALTGLDLELATNTRRIAFLQAQGRFQDAQLEQQAFNRSQSQALAPAE